LLHAHARGSQCQDEESQGERYELLRALKSHRSGPDPTRCSARPASGLHAQPQPARGPRYSRPTRLCVCAAILGVWSAGAVTARMWAGRGDGVRKARQLVA
jgi:hypothetical protein